jgi:hypothetical protein
MCFTSVLRQQFLLCDRTADVLGYGTRNNTRDGHMNRRFDIDPS